MGDKATRRALAAQQEEAMGALARLDFATRKKNAVAAKAAYTEGLQKLQGLVGALA